MSRSDLTFLQSKKPIIEFICAWIISFVLAFLLFLRSEYTGKMSNDRPLNSYLELMLDVIQGMFDNTQLAVSFLITIPLVLIIIVIYWIIIIAILYYQKPASKTFRMILLISMLLLWRFTTYLFGSALAIF